jgi:hypothetical protein
LFIFSALSVVKQKVKISAAAIVVILRKAGQRMLVLRVAVERMGFLREIV